MVLLAKRVSALDVGSDFDFGFLGSAEFENARGNAFELRRRNSCERVI